MGHAITQIHSSLRLHGVGGPEPSDDAGCCIGRGVAELDRVTGAVEHGQQVGDKTAVEISCHRIAEHPAEAGFHTTPIRRPEKHDDTVRCMILQSGVSFFLRSKRIDNKTAGSDRRITGNGRQRHPGRR